MFGIVDESGQLQYGQVFIRYTKNAALKLPMPTAERQVLKGKLQYNYSVLLCYFSQFLFFSEFDRL